MSSDAMTKTEWKRFRMKFLSDHQDLVIRAYGRHVDPDLGRKARKWLAEKPEERAERLTWVAELFDHPDSKWTMNEKERRLLKKLPETVTAYRGAQEGEEEGLSWTLIHAVAEMFATRFRCDGRNKARVLTATVPRSAIRALFLHRNEEEVVVTSMPVIAKTEAVDWDGRRWHRQSDEVRAFRHSHGFCFQDHGCYADGCPLMDPAHRAAWLKRKAARKAA